MQETSTTGNRYVKHFGPQWFAPPMGLGAFAVALDLGSTAFDNQLFAGLAQASTIVTILLTAGFLIPWLLRFVQYPDAVRKDFQHPIRSQFFPTMPISLLVIAIALQRTFADIIAAETLTTVLLSLFIAGSTGVFLFGIALSTILFTNTNIGTKHGVFAWYIPPVSHVLVPVVGFSLLMHGLAGGLLGNMIFLFSLIGLGVGTFMFLFLAPVVLHRYAYEDLPDVKLAPTFLIGIAPMSILIIDIARFIELLEAGVAIPITGAAAVPLLELGIGVLWGFAAWWGLLTLAIVGHYAITERHPFEFTWWAYTFPLGAFAIATYTTATSLGLGALDWFAVGVTVLLFVVLFVVTLLTSGQISRGEAFQPE